MASTWRSTRTRTRPSAISLSAWLQRMGIEADKFGSSTGTHDGIGNGGVRFGRYISFHRLCLGTHCCRLRPAS